MSVTALEPTLLIPAGRALLTGSFAYSVVLALRGEMDLETAFERLVAGFFTLMFFPTVADGLSTISGDLTSAIRTLNHGQSLKALLYESFKQAATQPNQDGTATSFNIPAVLEQAWRTGIWGIGSQIVDFCFLLAAFLLESSQHVLWGLLLVLFPLGCGVYPAFPKLMQNMAIYAVELSLWFPILAIIEIATTDVAKQQLARPGGWGLYLVAVEILSIYLTFKIPSVTHQFLSGAFSGDLGMNEYLAGIPSKAIGPIKSIAGGG